MKTLKLLRLETVNEDVVRLQSQLYVGRDVADFILDNNTLKCWNYGVNGFDFYKTDIPYKIISSKQDMIRQQL